MQQQQKETKKQRNKETKKQQTNKKKTKSQNEAEDRWEITGSKGQAQLSLTKMYQVKKFYKNRVLTIVATELFSNNNFFNSI